jgi:hypothetical protein
MLSMTSLHNFTINISNKTESVKINEMNLPNNFTDFCIEKANKGFNLVFNFGNFTLENQILTFIIIFIFILSKKLITYFFNAKRA